MTSVNPGPASSQTNNLSQVLYDSSSGNLTVSGNTLGTAPLGTVGGGVQTLPPNVSLLNGVFSPAAADRYPLNIGGQEQSVFYQNGQYYNLYTNGAAGISFTYCSSDPTVSSNWSAPVQVLGNNTGGETSTAKHGYAYLEGNTIYMYYINPTGIAVATASIPGAATTPVFTKVGLVFTGVPSGGSQNGNCCVIRYQATYYLFQECLTSTTNPNGEGTTNSWQIALLTCSTATGTFALQISPLQSLRPGPNASVSGGNIALIGNIFVMYYHGGTWGRIFPNDIYRATISASQIATDNWVINQPGAGSNTIPVNPAIMKRAHFYEFDQIADASFCAGPNGVSYLFYTACNNRAGIYQLMVTPFLPAPVQIDGAFTHSILGPYFTSPPYWNPDDSWAWQLSGPNLLSNPAKKQGTWGLVAAASQYGGVLAENTSATTGDYIEYDVTLAPGTYSINVLYATGTANGIFSLYLYDGYLLAPSAVIIDSYAASGANNVSTNVTYHVYGYETWRWRLRVACSSKNASSTGFLLSYSHISIQRTGN